MGQIRIDNLEIFANHGVLSEENVLGQKFIISIEMEVDTNAAANEDNIEKSVNYAEVCELAASFNREHRFNLIEAAADGLAIEILCKFPLVKSVEVEVKKPNPPIHMHFAFVSVKVKRKRHKAFISFGSNMGDKKAYINNALSALQSRMCTVKKVSSIFETEPYGGVEQDKFLNGCAEIETLYSPYELLEFLQKIESENGRERKVHWGPRTLDLDIVFFDDKIIREENLIIPHCDMHNRKFVLEPLCEIAPYYIHPVYKKTVRELSEYI